MKRKIRVYVAGSYTDPDTVKVWANQRVGMRMAVEVMLSGFVPFCPFIDYHFFLMLREHELLTVEMMYDYSLSWLEASDCVLVIRGWENSKGTKAEIKRAEELGMPVFYSLTDLIQAETEGNIILRR